MLINHLHCWQMTLDHQCHSATCCLGQHRVEEAEWYSVHRRTCLCERILSKLVRKVRPRLFFQLVDRLKTNRTSWLKWLGVMAYFIVSNRYFLMLLFYNAVSPITVYDQTQMRLFIHYLLVKKTMFPVLLLMIPIYLSLILTFPYWWPKSDSEKILYLFQINRLSMNFQKKEKCSLLGFSSKNKKYCISNSYLHI